MLQTVASTRSQIAGYNAQVGNKITTLHNNTVDKLTSYEDKYMPKVQKYDSM